MKRALGAAAAWLTLAALQAPAESSSPALSLWRLDCGEIHITNLDEYSDTYLYVGQQKTLTDSCYLIRNGDRYLLWDAGLPAELAGRAKEESGMRMSLRQSIGDQLAQIGVEPGQIEFVGISHYHFDHTGQLSEFPNATLLIGRLDWEALSGRPDRAQPFSPWVDGGDKLQTVQKDHDVFGDGRAVMLATPGHTPGHHSLLVRLSETGSVLLSGDVYHFSENVENRGVPGFNTDRAATLASMDRLGRIAENLGAKFIIQHEPTDVAELPQFPQAAH